MNWLAPSLTLVLFLLALLLAYRQGHRAGYKAGFLNGYEDGLADDAARPAPEPCQLPAVLEVVEVFQSENVLWRYGTGHTILTGYCPHAAYPAQALEKVKEHLDETRHARAADELIDDFLNTHGPFRNLDNGL